MDELQDVGSSSDWSSSDELEDAISLAATTFPSHPNVEIPSPRPLSSRPTFMKGSAGIGSAKHVAFSVATGAQHDPLQHLRAKVPSQQLRHSNSSKDFSPGKDERRGSVPRARSMGSLGDDSSSAAGVHPDMEGVPSRDERGDGFRSLKARLGAPDSSDGRPVDEGGVDSTNDATANADNTLEDGASPGSSTTTVVPSESSGIAAQDRLNDLIVESEDQHATETSTTAGETSATAIVTAADISTALYDIASDDNETPRKEASFPPGPSPTSSSPSPSVSRKETAPVSPPPPSPSPSPHETDPDTEAIADDNAPGQAPSTTDSMPLVGTVGAASEEEVRLGRPEKDEGQKDLDVDARHEPESATKSAPSAVAVTATSASPLLAGTEGVAASEQTGASLLPSQERGEESSGKRREAFVPDVTTSTASEHQTASSEARVNANVGAHAKQDSPAEDPSGTRGEDCPMPLTPSTAGKRGETTSEKEEEPRIPAPAILTPTECSPKLKGRENDEIGGDGAGSEGTGDASTPREMKANLAAEASEQEQAAGIDSAGVVQTKVGSAAGTAVDARESSSAPAHRALSTPPNANEKVTAEVKGDGVVYSVNAYPADTAKTTDAEEPGHSRSWLTILKDAIRKGQSCCR